MQGISYTVMEAGKAKQGNPQNSKSWNYLPLLCWKDKRKGWFFWHPRTGITWYKAELQWATQKDLGPPGRCSPRQRRRGRHTLVFLFLSPSTPIQKPADVGYWEIELDGINPFLSRQRAFKGNVKNGSVRQQAQDTPLQLKTDHKYKGYCI